MGKIGDTMKLRKTQTSINPARQLHIRGTNLDCLLNNARSFSLSITNIITTYCTKMRGGRVRSGNMRIFTTKNIRSHHLLDQHEDKSSFCMTRLSIVSSSQLPSGLSYFHNIHKNVLCYAIPAKLCPANKKSDTQLSGRLVN